jgi:hypothetical protein
MEETFDLDWKPARVERRRTAFTLAVAKNRHNRRRWKDTLFSVSPTEKCVHEARLSGIKLSDDANHEQFLHLGDHVTQHQKLLGVGPKRNEVFVQPQQHRSLPLHEIALVRGEKR